MARDKITVKNYTYEATDSVGVVAITPKTVTQANGIEIEKAFANKDNSLVITVNNTGSASTMVVKAGQKQNAIMGDCTIALASGVNEVALNRDMARFENIDGSVYIDFASGFAGTIYAVAEKAGLGS
jgi:hypothetical protein